MTKWNIYRGEDEFVGTIWGADSGDAEQRAQERFGVDVWVVPVVTE